MSFLSLHFAAMVAVLFVVYYILPKRFQPLLLLAGSLYFYYRCSGVLLLVMALTSLIAFLFGRLHHTIYGHSNTIGSSNINKISHKFSCGIFIFLLLSPLVLLKYGGEVFHNTFSVGLPIGISFYTLQLIAYCIDIYRGKYLPESNFFRFLLFTCFFPQILQGPIPRYNELKESLFCTHDYDKSLVAQGFSKILYGMFLKFLIANKAAVFVDSVFNSSEIIPGCAFLIAGILYSFQLYADFLACVLLAQGIALLFGIQLSENFMQPYCSTSIKDFWHRWHISLSEWLRDYVYIPLGGNRNGAFRTNLNLLLTFLVSGVWHGVGLNFALWGALHGIYQLIGKYSAPIRNKFFSAIMCPKLLRTIIQRLTTFLLVMIAWIIFRANSLVAALQALYAILFRFDANFVLSGGLLTFDLPLSEFLLLILCIILLLYQDNQRNKGKMKPKLFYKNKTLIQCLSAITILLIIAVFGTYGIGYDSSTFIYGGF